MKNRIWIMMAAVATVLTIGSCREQSDDVLSYGQNDAFNFMAADTCFEGQFKAMWTALNCNYGIWDYEAKYGLNWDAVYSQYLPKTQALDKRDKETNPVTDEELSKLYEEILSPLHDGHFMVKVKNLHTGNFLALSPANIRNKSRADFDINTPPVMDFYTTSDAGENEVVEYSYVPVKPAIYFNMQIQEALQKIDQAIGELTAIENRTDLQEYFLQKYLAAQDELSNFSVASMDDFYYFNSVLTTKYSDLGITLYPFDISDSNCWIKVKYATFKDGIAYFGFTGFHLSPFLTGQLTGSPCKDLFSTYVSMAWRRWVEVTQTLHKEGKLKGVIIDVRNNGGGSVNDYQYVLGALLPSGGHQVASARFKTGIGRYDYSPLTPEVIPTFSEEHETITEPVVVLANCHSVSMSEVTCLGAKQMENARVIGTNTWGGMCLLAADPSAYSIYYASAVGVENETPFWAYIPANVTVTNEGGILEGVGVTPDIEVAFDMDLYNSTGRDSQLERALQYIRTGN